MKNIDDQKIIKIIEKKLKTNKSLKVISGYNPESLLPFIKKNAEKFTESEIGGLLVNLAISLEHDLRS